MILLKQSVFHLLLTSNSSLLSSYIMPTLSNVVHPGNISSTSMVKLVTIRMLWVIASQFSWKVHQINIRTVSLNGDIKIQVFMEKPQDSLQRVKKHGYVGESSVWPNKSLKHGANTRFSFTNLSKYECDLSGYYLWVQF